MDIREVIEKCKPFAPVLSAAVVAACVAGSLYGYKVPVYEMNASVEETQEQQDEVPVVKTSTEDAEDETAEDEEQAKGSFDLEDGVYQGTGTGYRGDITVAVKIKDKQIASIEILSASDDEPFFGRAKGLIDYQKTEHEGRYRVRCDLQLQRNHQCGEKCTDRRKRQRYDRLFTGRNFRKPEYDTGSSGKCAGTVIL